MFLGPQDAVPHRSSVFARDREEPKQLVCAEDLHPVKVASDVELVDLRGRLASLLVPLSLEIFDGGSVGKHQLDVELEEH